MDRTKLDAAMELAEDYMAKVSASDATHQLASALHLVIDELRSDAQPSAAAAVDAVEGDEDTEPGGTLLEALPPPSIPPGLYEPPRTDEGRPAGSASAAPSHYEPRRNADGTYD
jgi:hypothetical protein